MEGRKSTGTRLEGEAGGGEAAGRRTARGPQRRPVAGADDSAEGRGRRARRRSSSPRSSGEGARPPRPPGEGRA